MPDLKIPLIHSEHDTLGEKQTTNTDMHKNDLCKLISSSTNNENTILDLLSRVSLTETIQEKLYFCGANVLLVAAMCNKLHILPNEKLQAVSAQELTTPCNNGIFKGQTVLSAVLNNSLKNNDLSSACKNMRVFTEVLAPKIDFSNMLSQDNDKEDSLITQSLMLLKKGHTDFFKYLTKNYAAQLDFDTLMCSYKKTDGTLSVPFMEVLKSNSYWDKIYLLQHVAAQLSPEKIAKWDAKPINFTQVLFSMAQAYQYEFEYRSTLCGPYASAEKKQFIEKLNQAKAKPKAANYNELIDDATKLYQHQYLFALDAISPLVKAYGNAAAKIKYALTLKALEPNIFLTTFPFNVSSQKGLISDPKFSINLFNLQKILDEDINPKLSTKGLVISPYFGLAYDEDESDDESDSIEDSNNEALQAQKRNRRDIFDQVINLPVFDEYFESYPYDNSDTGTITDRRNKTIKVAMVLSNKKIQPEIACENILGAIEFKINLKNKKYCHINCLGIDVEEQGRGLGSILLQAAMYIASTLGVHQFSLESTSDGVKTYVRHGMKVHDEAYTPCYKKINEGIESGENSSSLEVDYLDCDSVQKEQCNKTFAKGLNVLNEIIQNSVKNPYEHQINNSILTHLALGIEKINMPDWLFSILRDLHEQNAGRAIKQDAHEYLLLFYKQQVTECVQLVKETLTETINQVNNHAALDIIVELKAKLGLICDQVSNGQLSGEIAKQSRHYVSEIKLILISIKQLESIGNDSTKPKNTLDLIKSDILGILKKIEDKIEHIKAEPGLLKNLTKQMQVNPPPQFAYPQKKRTCTVFTESESEAILYGAEFNDVGPIAAPKRIKK